MWKNCLALCLVVALAGCGLPRNVVVLVPNEDGSVGKISVTTNQTEARLSAPYTASATGPNGATLRVFQTDEKTVASAFAGALAGTPRKPLTFVIYFVNGETKVESRSADTVHAA